MTVYPAGYFHVMLNERGVFVIWKLRKVMWSERYLLILTGLVLFCQFQIISKIWHYARYNSLIVSYSAFDNSMMLDPASMHLRFSLIVFVVMACVVGCGNLYCDDMHGGLGQLLARESVARYHGENLFVVFVSSFLLTAIPLLCNMGTALFCYPLEGMDNIYAYPAYANLPTFNESLPLTVLHSQLPCLYVLVLIFMLGMTCSAFSVLCYGVSVATGWNAYMSDILTFLIYFFAGIFPYQRLLVMSARQYSLLSYLTGDDQGSLPIFLALVLLVMTFGIVLSFWRKKDLV